MRERDAPRSPRAARSPSSSTLRRLQRGLERLYRLDAAPDVRDFLLEEDDPVRVSVQRRPAEQVFVATTTERDELRLGVFLEDRICKNLELRDPRTLLNDDNLHDLLMAVEAISHYLCLIHCARARRQVRQLELELQAEIDKYLVCLLLLEEQGESIENLAQRLATRLSLATDLSDEEHARYEAAAELADAYARALEGRFVRGRRFPHLLDEVRRFYRLTLDAKRSRIMTLAA